MAQRYKQEFRDQAISDMKQSGLSVAQAVSNVFGCLGWKLIRGSIQAKALKEYRLKTHPKKLISWFNLSLTAISPHLGWLQLHLKNPGSHPIWTPP